MFEGIDGSQVRASIKCPEVIDTGRGPGEAGPGEQSRHKTALQTGQQTLIDYKCRNQDCLLRLLWSACMHLEIPLWESWLCDMQLVRLYPDSDTPVSTPAITQTHIHVQSAKWYLDEKLPKQGHYMFFLHIEPAEGALYHVLCNSDVVLIVRVPGSMSLTLLALPVSNVCFLKLCFRWLHQIDIWILCSGLNAYWQLKWISAHVVLSYLLHRIVNIQQILLVWPTFSPVSMNKNCWDHLRENQGQTEWTAK